MKRKTLMFHSRLLRFTHSSMFVYVFVHKQRQITEVSNSFIP